MGTTKNTNWGRNDHPTKFDLLSTSVIFWISPLVLGLFQGTNLYYKGNLYQAIQEIRSGSWLSFIFLFLDFNPQVLWVCLGWIGFQAFLAFLPDLLGKCLPRYVGGSQIGMRTPGGATLKYNINGLQAWILTHLIFFLVCFYYGSLDPTWIARNWIPLLTWANVSGYGLSILAYLKAKVYPSYPSDNKETGHFFYDFVMGIEHNPRIFGFDLKLFFNGRPGILAWTLINLSFACLQHQRYGLTDSMILVNLMQALYVLDFFWNEKWYLSTLDIAHDHFGWMLAWGDCAWLPFMYTLQASYLASVPISLGMIRFGAILCLGLGGHVLCRWVNYQKDYFRSSLSHSVISPNDDTGPKRSHSVISPNDDTGSFRSRIIIWGKRPLTVTCTYWTKEGTRHGTQLLCSGFWGYARHLNYTGDLLLSLSYCLACGSRDVLPYFYFLYMTVLLITRCLRDEQRCERKYGESWKLYCARVPYRLIPWIF